jgi:hypothetical protein
MTEIETLQKRIIEMQDVEIGRIRLELDQVKFELSKLRALQSPVPSLVTFPDTKIYPTLEYVPSTTPTPPWTITCDSSTGVPILKLNKNVSSEVPESTK